MPTPDNIDDFQRNSFDESIEMKKVKYLPNKKKRLYSA